MAERRMCRRSPTYRKSDVQTDELRWRLAVAADVVCSEFRDDNPERTLGVVFYLWWNTGLREQGFFDLLQEARAITKEHMAAGQVQLGDAGRRRAMPYFLVVLEERAALAQAHASDEQPGRPKGGQDTPK
jgi:hypothetical protein